MTALWRKRVNKKTDEIKRSESWKIQQTTDENVVCGDYNDEISGRDLHSRFIEQQISKNDEFFKNPDSRKTVQDNEEVDFDGSYSAHLSKDHLNQFSIGEENNLLKKLFFIFNLQKFLQVVLHTILKIVSMAIPSETTLGKITSKIRYILSKILLALRMRTLLRFFTAALMLKKQTKYKVNSKEQHAEHELHYEAHQNEHGYSKHSHAGYTHDHSSHTNHSDHSHHGHHVGYHLHVEHSNHLHEVHTFHHGLLSSISLGHDAHVFHEPHPPHHDHNHEHFHYHKHEHVHHKEHQPHDSDILGRIFHRIRQAVRQGSDFLINQSWQFLSGGTNSDMRFGNNLSPTTVSSDKTNSVNNAKGAERVNRAFREQESPSPTINFGSTTSQILVGLLSNSGRK